MRKQFELSNKQIKRIKDASKSVPAMWLSNGTPMFGTPQENVNAVWREVGRELGFKWDTAKPVPGKKEKFISAEAL